MDVEIVDVEIVDVEIVDVEIVLRVDGTEHRLVVDTRTVPLDARRRAAAANLVPAIRDAAGAARR